MARVVAQQSLYLLQGGGRLVLSVQYDRIVVARSLEARRQFQAPRQQVLRVLITAEARCDLRKHPNGRHIGGIPLQMFTQQQFGRGNAVLAQRSAGSYQPRIVG